MPTYELRTGIDYYSEHGVQIHTSDSVETYKILTEARAIFASLPSYQVGETLTETGTGVTGVIYWIDTALKTVGLVNCSDEFDGDAVLTGSVSLQTGTPSSFENTLNKTAETPTYTPVVTTHAITSTGIGDNQTITLDETTEWLLFSRPTGGDITVYNYDTNTTLEIIKEGISVSTPVEESVRQIVMAFSAAGSCAVIEAQENLLGGELRELYTESQAYDATLDSLKVAVVDDTGTQITSFGSPSTLADFKSPADFTATYTSNVTITLASLTNLTITDSSQIVYVRQVKSDNTSAVYVNGSGGVTLTHSGGVITIHGAGTPFAAGDVYEVGINALPRAYDDSLNATQVMIVDDTGTQITSFGSPSTIATHRSPEDFTVTYTSNVTITLASLPSSITDDSQIVYIRVVPSSGDAAVYVNGSGGVTMRESGSVITISGAGTPFAAGDAYEVGLNLQDKSYDDSLDLTKTQEQSPVYSRYTDVVVVEDTPQNLTGAWVDVGSEQDTRGYKSPVLWLTVDINDSLNVRIQILAKHTSAGAEEYNVPIQTVSASLVKLQPQVFEFDLDSDQLLCIPFEVDNAIPYIQVQCMAVTPGATPGQIDAAYITKGY